MVTLADETNQRSWLFLWALVGGMGGGTELGCKAFVSKACVTHTPFAQHAERGRMG